MSTLNNLGEYLRRCRDASGLSQSQVAQRVREAIREEVAPWYINKVERGALRQPSTVRLRAMCMIIGADYDEALRLGEYPGYSLNGDTDPVPAFLRARLSQMGPAELSTLDQLWPAIEDLVRRAMEVPLSTQLVTASGDNPSTPYTTKEATDALPRAAEPRRHYPDPPARRSRSPKPDHR